MCICYGNEIKFKLIYDLIFEKDVHMRNRLSGNCSMLLRKVHPRVRRILLKVCYLFFRFLIEINVLGF